MKTNENPVHEQQRNIINRMLEEDFEGHMNTSKYAKLAKCSNDTALRDIQDLVTRGIFVLNSGGGRSTSYRLIDQVKDWVDVQETWPLDFAARRVSRSKRSSVSVSRTLSARSDSTLSRSSSGVLMLIVSPLLKIRNVLYFNNHNSKHLELLIINNSILNESFRSITKLFD